MKYLDNKKKNILLTILVAAICFIAIINSGTLEGAGMAAIIIIWMAPIIGVITIVGYLILNLITKKYSPIVTILGNFLNVFLAISSFFS